MKINETNSFAYLHLKQKKSRWNFDEISNFAYLHVETESKWKVGEK